MKTNLMMKMILTLALCLQISTYANAQESQGNDKGNGGGGVVQDGRYMTFGSAGLYVDSAGLGAEQIPMLQYVTDVVMSDPYIDIDTSTDYLKFLLPSDNRKYFKVLSSKFTPEARNRLIAEYSRITNLDASKLALFAITDTTSKTTYLLPEFYSLKQAEQAAILFHEAYWVANPNSTYSLVVDAEIAFQKYIENTNIDSLHLRWLSKLIKKNNLLSAAFKMDVSKSTLLPLAQNNKVLLKNIIGADALYCYINSSTKNLSTNDCNQMSLKFLYALKNNISTSLFIKLMFTHLTSNNTLRLYTVDSLAHNESLSHYCWLNSKISCSETLATLDLGSKEINGISGDGIFLNQIQKTFFLTLE